MSIYAILGAGNGGQVLAAALKDMRHEVRLWDGIAGVIERIRQLKEIEVTGAIDTHARPDVISEDVAEVVNGAKIVFIVVPAYAHRDVAKVVAPLIQPHQVVVLNPGRTAGALEFRQTLIANGCKEPPVIAESQTLLYTCRLKRPGSVEVLAIKKSNLLACLPQGQEQTIERELSPIYRALTWAHSTLVTGLGNIGSILHPAPVLLNTGWIESRDVFFSHYYSGISKSIAGFLEKMDQERLSVAEAFDIRVPSVKQWHQQVYGHGGKNLFETLRRNESYASIDAPRSLDHRYLLEDIPAGLVPISELGRAAGIPTPYMDLIVDLARAVTGIDFHEKGRTLERLGLQGKTVRGIIEAF